MIERLDIWEYVLWVSHPSNIEHDGARRGGPQAMAIALQSFVDLHGIEHSGLLSYEAQSVISSDLEHFAEDLTRFGCRQYRCMMLRMSGIWKSVDRSLMRRRH